MTKASCIFVLENPPQGPSVADGYAERCNQGAEIRMAKTMTKIEQSKQKAAMRLENERKKVAKDLGKIKSSKYKKSQGKHTNSNFLDTERSKLKEGIGNNNSDNKGSDCDISEESLDDKSDSYSDDGSVDSCQGELDNKKGKQRSPRACERHRTSYHERSREDRLTNLHRRFSAQINTETVVDVKRVQKLLKSKSR